MMYIKDFRDLISNLPVRRQAFKTKRTTWKKAEYNFEWLKQLNASLFNDSETFFVSRQDIFNTESTRELFIKTIYWGYPRGMRGNNFVNILENINIIENSFDKLKGTPSPTLKDFSELTKSLKKVPGLGLSTYSKILYFMQISFNNNPCLILDKRLIDVFANKLFFEYSSLDKIKYYNAEKYYLDYLDLSNEIATNLGVQCENIEQFLFIYSNNIK